MLKVKISHYDLLSLAKKKPENYEMLQAMPELKLPSLFDMLADKGYYTVDIFVNSIEDLPDWFIPLAAFERPETLKLIKPNGSTDTASLEKALKLNQVHLPDMKLMNIRKVKAVENICTEELQELLDGGWSIIAVCIQPNQRRPDYILGMVSL